MHQLDQIISELAGYHPHADLPLVRRAYQFAAEAHDGPSALRLLDRQDSPIDLLVTDVVMPDENGLDLIPRIRRIRPDLRVVVMSAQSTLMTAVKATQRGAFEYLPKPFDLQELLSVVGRALAAPPKDLVPPPADQRDAEFLGLGDGDLHRPVELYLLTSVCADAPDAPFQAVRLPVIETNMKLAGAGVPAPGGGITTSLVVLPTVPVGRPPGMFTVCGVAFSTTGAPPTSPR